MTNNKQFGDENLLNKIRELACEIEKLPAGYHQTQLILHISTASFALQQLQKTGDHFWPKPSGLSDNRIENIKNNIKDPTDYLEFARAIEREHNITTT